MAATAIVTTERRKRRPLKRLRHLFEAAVVKTLVRAVPLFPRRVVLAIGRGIGTAAYFVMARDRKVAFANLDIAFGDTISPARKRQIARKSFRSFAATIVGLFWAPRLSERNIRRWVEISPQSEERLRAILDLGRGLIIATPHYGDWELGSLAAGFLGFNYMGVGESAANPRISALVARMRSTSGHMMIPPRYALIKLFKHLRRGGSVALVVDANGRRGRGGVWLDFFGLPVFNSAAAVELAIRANAAVIFGYAKPLPRGRIELIFEEEIQTPSTGDRDADVRALSQLLLDRCANLIRAHPEPWLWTYKRWKRRPTPEMGRFPFYSKYDEKT